MKAYIAHRLLYRLYLLNYNELILTTAGGEEATTAFDLNSLDFERSERSPSGLLALDMKIKNGDITFTVSLFFCPYAYAVVFSCMYFFIIS